LGTETAEQRVPLRNLEGCFELSFVLFESDLIRGRTPSDEQRNGIDEERLACSGFPRQDGETRLEAQTELVKDGEIDDAQLSEHGCEREAS
jgi:hypothetical protein